MFTIYIIILGNNIKEIIEYRNEVPPIFFIIYTSSAILCVALIYLAYCKSDIKFLRYSYIILAARNVFSMHDFENMMQAEEKKPLFYLSIMVVFSFI